MSIRLKVLWVLFALLSMALASTAKANELYKIKIESCENLSSSTGEFVCSTTKYKTVEGSSIGFKSFTASGAPKANVYVIVGTGLQEARLDLSCPVNKVGYRSFAVTATKGFLTNKIKVKIACVKVEVHREDDSAGADKPANDRKKTCKRKKEKECP